MNQISFLIGSGFSVPGEIPTTTDINNRLSHIKESEICISNSQDARFLIPGEFHPNSPYTNVEKRRFVQDFIEFYNATFLKESGKFHYEDFFDYYFPYVNGAQIPKNLSEFLDKFKTTNHLTKDGQSLLFDFNLTFNQLIQGLLHKKFERIGIGRPYDPKYGAFLYLLDEICEDTIIHFHSLNHDLFMEYLSQSDTLSQKFDDGFEEIGSPYYGELRNDLERYMIRLPRFINKYEKQFRLYKLHGSIDHYWYNGDISPELIKLKWGLGKTDAFKEIIENGIPKYKKCPLFFYPDFLSGTTAKIERYDNGGYYPRMFSHFTDNLKNSSLLIIIGYGFGDKKINEIIEEKFSLKDNKKIFIVDIKKPNLQWFNSHSVFYVDGGVAGMDIQEIVSKI